MIRDFHTHPTVVMDESRFDAYARHALSVGVQEIAITDHMPLSCNGASDRIPAGRVGDYCAAVRRIAKKYEGALSVKLGIEIDYHPDYAHEIEAVLKAGDFDFVRGSAHLHVGQLDIFNMISGQNEYARLAEEAGGIPRLLDVWYETQANAILKYPYPAMLGHFLAAHSLDLVPHSLLYAPAEKWR